MNYVLQLLVGFIFFDDVQMIFKSVLDISNGKKATRNPKACGSILEQFLSKLIPFNFFIHNSSFDIELDDFIKIAVNE